MRVGSGTVRGQSWWLPAFLAVLATSCGDAAPDAPLEGSSISAGTTALLVVGNTALGAGDAAFSNA